VLLVLNKKRTRLTKHGLNMLTVLILMWVLLLNSFAKVLVCWRWSY